LTKAEPTHEGTSPAPSSRIPFVALRRKLGRAIKQGHPWIYRESIEPPAAELAAGTIVAVGEKGAQALGWGFWDPSSAIAVRLLSKTRLAAPAAWLDERLASALALRRAIVTTGQTNTLRLVHGEADGMAGVHVDLYDAYASVRYDGEGARQFYGAILATHLGPALARAFAGSPLRPLRGVLERRRGARADSQGAPESARLLWGDAPTEPVVVKENDVLFVVDLLNGQKGGLFLDQRDNRALIRDRARGCDVLNLFGYTGGFSLYAAKGGARSTTTVDLSAGAIETARLNFERNGLPLADAELVARDAFAFLEEAQRQGRRWDLVISDPPSFAPSQKALPRALTAYTRLHGMAAAVVKPGGIFCAASCSSHVDGPTFLETVHAGVARIGRSWREEAMHGAGVDHPVAAFFPEGAYLKFALGRMDEGPARPAPRHAPLRDERGGGPPARGSSRPPRARPR